MTATIRIDRPASPGTADRSRTDGVANETVTLVSVNAASETSWAWRIVSVAPEGISAPTITNATSSTSTFPAPASASTLLIELVVDSGLATESVSRRLYAIRTASGLRNLVFAELSDPDNTLQSNDPASSTDNEGGSWGGWADDLNAWLAQIEANAGGGGVSDLQGAYDGGDAITTTAGTPVSITATAADQDAISIVEGRLDMPRQMAIGEGASTGASTDGMAIGYLAEATANRAIGIGPSVDAYGVEAIAIGSGIVNEGASAIAIGADHTVATGSPDGIAIGRMVTPGDRGIGIGLDVTPAGDSSVAIGYQIGALGLTSVAIGSGAQAPLSTGVAVGAGAQANVQFGVAIGRISQIAAGAGDGGIAIGDTARVNATNQTSSNAIAIGTDATIEGNSNIAIGNNARIISDASNHYFDSIAMGRGAQVSASNGIAIGHDSDATATGATVIGVDAYGAGQRSIVLGIDANAINGAQQSTADDAIGMGWRSNPSGNGGIAIGRESVASGPQSIAIGWGADALSNDDAIAVGTNAQSTGLENVAIGAGAQATASRSVAIGVVALASGSNTYAMGYAAKATSTGAIAIGVGAEAGARSIAIGANAVAGNNEVVIGSGAGVTHWWFGRGKTSTVQDTDILWQIHDAEVGSGLNGTNWQLRAGLGDGAGTDGKIVLMSATVFTDELLDAFGSPGTSGQVLVSQGPGQPPVWTTI